MSERPTFVFAINLLRRVASLVVEAIQPRAGGINQIRIEFDRPRERNFRFLQKSKILEHQTQSEMSFGQVGVETDRLGEARLPSVTD